MRVIIVGGGKVGGNLASRLMAEDHVVTVLEPDREAAQNLADVVPCLVLEGDGTSVEMLRSADIDRADWLLAVTGRDEVNLVAAELAEALGPTSLQVVARVNDPRNERTFEALGIRPVSVTTLMSQIIANAAEAAIGKRIVIDDLGERLTVVDVAIPAGTPARPVVDIGLPEDTILVRVMRNGDALVPRGDTRIEAGDRVLAVTRLEQEPAVYGALRGGAP